MLLPPATLVLLLTLPPAAPPPQVGRVDFNRDVRPILSDACFRCHGPDKGQRKAGLRLDTADGLRGAVKPGDPDGSELLHRVGEADPKRVMPPPASGKPLTATQLATLRRWIAQGADWQPHWAFLAPARPTPPTVAKPDWSRNPIDNFVLARLEREGLAPSAEAAPLALLRRVSLDLTGLPPTPAEADAFLADTAPGAYERLVDRLLASPRHGERLAVRWLDAARYADTSGYQSDGERVMWRWRDGVIDALNANQPFDRFTLEQLAGDLLPGATLEQKIASGFNRNHRGNAEGGIVPEEYAAEYVADRVETTGTVWMGLTLACARCHTHKYDPVSIEEFYQLFAFFNNIPEFGRAIKFGNSPPVLPSPTRSQRERLRDLDARLHEARERVRGLRPAQDRAQRDWERTWKPAGPTPWAPQEGLALNVSLAGPAEGGAWKGSPPAFREGGAALTGVGHLELPDAGSFDYLDRFSFSFRVRTGAGGGGTVVSRMTDVPRGDGYAVRLERGHLHVDLVKRWLDDALRVRTATPLPPDRWHAVTVSYDGSRQARGVKVYVDGQEVALATDLDLLNQTFTTREPFRVGGGGGPTARFRGDLADLRIYRRVLTPAEAGVLGVTARVEELLTIPPERRTAFQAAKLESYFLAHHAPPLVREARRTGAALEAERAGLLDAVPTTMVMEEMPTPRATHVLLRGQYDRPGPRVRAGVPAVFPPLPAGGAPDRLALARWLVAPEHPLTARVAVNRQWQMLFGQGLVRTTEDFGAQGEPPTHPELLDWLAVEYREGGWDTKRLLRLIVTSATYRQSSRVAPELRARDPENRLLARATRLRWPAEVVRDSALAGAGLLVERLGGPSVKPYQPDGLWQELGDATYTPDRGENLYRRGLYTYWKRTAPPPGPTTLDAPGREACTVRDTRTNTPLQALHLMNDVTYVEAARHLARRALTEGPPDADSQLTFLFRLALTRPPREPELKVLRAALDRHRSHFRAHPADAVALLRVGDSPPDGALDRTEWAARAAVAATILNLDETVTRE